MAETNTAILFVCLGNICRSPLAEGIFSAEVERSGHEGHIKVDSAATSGWHVGEPPHPAAQRAARARGVDLSGQRCRQIEMADFTRFDLVLAMDRAVLAQLHALRTGSGGRAADSDLFLNYAGFGDKDVPDPYGQPDAKFAAVAETIERASPAILKRLMAG